MVRGVFVRTGELAVPPEFGFQDLGGAAIVLPALAEPEKTLDGGGRGHDRPGAPATTRNTSA